MIQLTARVAGGCKISRKHLTPGRRDDLHMTDELITDLAKNSNLRVISRTSVPRLSDCSFDGE